MPIPYQGKDIPYQILISEEGLEKIKKYKEELENMITSQGGISNVEKLDLETRELGSNLELAIINALGAKGIKNDTRPKIGNDEFIKNKISSLEIEEFIECFLQARNEFIEDNSQRAKNLNSLGWTKKEVQLSALMSLAMQVEVYDNGETNALHHESYKRPLQALMAYVSGPLNRDYADKEEIEENEQNEKLYQLIESRLLPVFANFNTELKEKNKKGFVTLPPLGCGPGGIKVDLFYRHFKKFLKRNSQKFEEIKGFYLDDYYMGSVKSFNENTGETPPIKMAKDALGKREITQLSDLQNGDYGEEFKDCMLCTIVDWHPLTREGNLARKNFNISNYGSRKLRSTNVLSITHDLPGSYDNRKEKFFLDSENTNKKAIYYSQLGEDKRLLRANSKNIRVVNRDGEVKNFTLHNRQHLLNQEQLKRQNIELTAFEEQLKIVQTVTEEQEKRERKEIEKLQKEEIEKLQKEEIEASRKESVDKETTTTKATIPELPELPESATEKVKSAETSDLFQITRTIDGPNTSFIPVISTKADFAKKLRNESEDTGLKLTGDANTDNIKIIERSKKIAGFIMNAVNLKIRDLDAVGSFSEIMKELAKEQIKSKENAGSKAGFTYWRNGGLIQAKLVEKGCKDNKIDETIKKFQIISKTVQEESAKYFDTAWGRKYPKIKREIGARSYRLVQLLDEANENSFSVDTKKSGSYRS